MSDSGRGWGASSDEEIVRRNREKTERIKKREEFIAAGERAAAWIATWPRWKQLSVEEALINSPLRREARLRMASYNVLTINPKTGLTEPSKFLPHHYGLNKFGIQFETDGEIYPSDGVMVVDTSSTPEANEFDYAELETKVLDAMCKRIHTNNINAGWWDSAENSLVVPTKIALIISECVEAMEGHRRGLMDDKLTDEKMIGVELADVLIRVFDLCGFLGVDVGTLLAKKAAYNATRADHKPENRAKVGGKKY
jgi:NTP pyrophosphatase (non-canonical NTP hydrolase)